METERTRAIVLRVQPVTESSLLATWFSRDFGKLKTLAKGARRAKSLLRGKIDLFYEDEILFLRSHRSDLHLLQDCFLENPHRKLRENVTRLTAASYACELVDAVTVGEDPNPAMYDLLAEVLTMLERRTDVVLLIWLELQLLNAAGWQPPLKGLGGTEKVLRSLSGASVAGVQRVRLTDEQARAARAALQQFREAYLGRSLRSQNLLVKIQR